MKKIKEGQNISAPVKNKSFFKTLLFSLLGLSVIITFLLTLFLTANYFRTSLSITTAFNRNLLSQTNYTITQMDDNAQRLTQALFGDKDIISFLNMKEHDSMIPILASRTLDKQLMTLPFVDSIYLYNASLDLFFSSKSSCTAGILRMNRSPLLSLIRILQILIPESPSPARSAASLMWLKRSPT